MCLLLSNAGTCHGVFIPIPASTSPWPGNVAAGLAAHGLAAPLTLKQNSVPVFPGRLRSAAIRELARRPVEAGPTPCERLEFPPVGVL